MMNSIENYPYPVEKAKVLVKIVYSGIGRKVDFLNKAYSLYKNDLSEFGDSAVKKIVRAQLKYLENIAEFTYDNEKLRTKLNDHIGQLFFSCFKFLKFQNFDVQKLKSNPLDLIIDIENMIGDCVSAQICVK